ncbi:MAG: peptide-methionine (S)-S-oxide reductase MsrA [Hyphomicrobium sp.]
MFRLPIAASIFAFLFAANAAPEVPAATLVAMGPTEIATFGAGCYWCVERDFDAVKGVVETTPGFMGGTVENPTLDEIHSGATGDTEVVTVKYDPTVVSYKDLLDYYWMHVDPFDADGQFCDRGPEYRPAIFVYNDDQKKLAEESKQNTVAQLMKPVVVEIAKASAFTPAPDPDFYKTNPIRYKYYRAGCGRDARIKQIWRGKPG